MCRDLSKMSSMWWCNFIFLGIFVNFALSQRQCEQRSCYPATGDLLIGRERNLTSTSTCGLRGPSKYCIVGFLKENEKCFYCDSRKQVSNKKISHRPEDMISRRPNDKLDKWWQAENGKETVVIQLDLEAEFHFTHLILTFKTFRPAGMVVEKSANYGRTWKVYRYFADNCDKVFPGISKGPQRKINEIICEEKYSQLEPSTEGEIVMKVLDPQILRLDPKNPNSEEVQHLLKLTNLRIKFTKLHTLGDDVLNQGREVQEKYYYALYEMVVRGSCSCYGHAEVCLPVPGAPNDPNMVHGQCNCTHNTEGKNCERCIDGYNDQPWRPALYEHPRACEKCNCHDHSVRCHFDPAVYKATGNVSGGVCDGCHHNTTGRQCELCKPLFYRDPFKDKTDPNICLPCDCDPAGSIGGGECETVTDPISGTVAGRCICKANVEGKRCDMCKDGHWNLLESNVDGCQSCNCDKQGTVSVSTCDRQTGICNCKRVVRGDTCGQCFPRFWGLGSTPDGCQSCNCDAGGAYSENCDEIQGSCQCRPNIIGRRCDKVRPGYYFALLDINRFEAENAVLDTGFFRVVKRERPPNAKITWTGDGFAKVKCESIFDFTMARVSHSGNYEVVVRYQPESKDATTTQSVAVKISRADGRTLSGGPCRDSETTKSYFVGLDPKSDYQVIQLKACFQKNIVYNIRMEFVGCEPGGAEYFLIDSVVLVPDIDDITIFQGREGFSRKHDYVNNKCKEYYLSVVRPGTLPEICKDLQFSISAITNAGALPCQCDPVGTQANATSDVLTCQSTGGKCPCKMNTIGRRCDRCAPGSFGFGDNGCQACSCDSVGSKSNFCDSVTGQCQCVNQVVGRQCSVCPANYFGFPDCQPCECNNHSRSCDPKTGVCLNCKDNTAGDSCEKCAAEYYGEATKGSSKDCKKCQCPGGSSGNQFSRTCNLDKSTNQPVCDQCQEGYEGRQCEKCSDGYFGNPLVPGGFCRKCHCNNNISPAAVGKCDAVTGNCFNCLHNTDGSYCEKCKKGFFGNALNRTCIKCVCNSLGSNSASGGICDRVTGQCSCLLHVAGTQCDRCEPGYWNLASGKGCQSCSCDKEGSLEAQCNQLDGQCRCRAGFGGTTCSECEDLFWGDPKAAQCKPCLCNPSGSISTQCDRKSGKCRCRPGVIGNQCDMCAARTTGVMPKCEPCHPCYDQWDDTLSKIEKNMTNYVSGNITTPGDIYDKDLEKLKKRPDEIAKILANRTVNAKDVNAFRKELDEFRKSLTRINDNTLKIYTSLRNTTSRNKEANTELDRLEKYGQELVAKANRLVMNMTDIAYGDAAYAYNVTLQSRKRSRMAKTVVDAANKTLDKSKEMRNKMEKEVLSAVPKFDDLHQKNKGLLNNLTSRLLDLEGILNRTNRMLCGGENGCGGCTPEGCDSCGGGNCTGVKNLAQVALNVSKEAEFAMRTKEKQAKIMMTDAQRLEDDVNRSHSLAKKALGEATNARKVGEEVTQNITVLIKDIVDFLGKNYRDANMTRKLANMALSLNISLTPSELVKLAKDINETVRNLTNVEKILNDAKDDLNLANDLKEQAIRAKNFSSMVAKMAGQVIDILKKIEKQQMTTDMMLNMINNTYKKLTNTVDDLKKRRKKMDVDLSGALEAVKKMEKTTKKVDEQFRKNRKNIEAAEKASESANKEAEAANKTAKDIKGKFGEAQATLKDKSSKLADARRRAIFLGTSAKNLYEGALKKIKNLEDLLLRSTKNVETVGILDIDLEKLERQIRLVQNMIHKITNCHANCNPQKDTFCTSQGLPGLEQRYLQLRDN